MRKHNPAPRQRDDDENEVNALYWALRRQQQKQAEENRLKCISEMEEAIKDLGLPKPQCQTMYQFRITHNEVKLDTYPVNRRWHNVTTNERGRIRDMATLLRREFNIAP